MKGGHHAKRSSLQIVWPFHKVVLIEKGKNEEVPTPSGPAKGSSTPHSPSHVDKGIFLQVKFPPELAPFEFKVFNLDKNCTVSQVQFHSLYLN
jgi:hypothetical protein